MRRMDQDDFQASLSYLVGQNDILRLGSLESNQTEKKRQVKRVAGLYLFKRKDVLRVKVTAPSDTIYHCHLLMQTQDKRFGGNFSNFSYKLNILK